MKKHQLRIVLSTNAPWTISGYGQAAADLLPLLIEEGYPVACIAFYGLAGGSVQWETKSPLTGQTVKVPVYPIMNHSFGSDALLWHGKDFNADVSLTLQDVWALNPQDLSQVNRFIPWVPIDHDPVPQGILQNLRFANRIITMSKFGQNRLRDLGFSSTFIPHTVDTRVFHPLNRPQRKKEVGIQAENFIFGMVAANKELPPRKSFQEVMDAFKLFLEKVPNALLYIHSNPKFPGGFDFEQYAVSIGIQQRVLHPDPYLLGFKTGKEEMNLIYNTLDCLLAPSVSEGFGVPIIEAQATGIPVITSDWTAMSELVQDNYNGFKVKEAAQYRWSMLQSQTFVPDTKDLFDKMMLVYRADRDKIGKNARKFAEENYSLEKVFKRSWLPFFGKIEKELYGERPEAVVQELTNVK